VIRTSYRQADDRDFHAVTRDKDKGSPVRNLLQFSLPAALVLFAGVYLIWRSILAAGLIGGLFFAASVVSNVRFFAGVRRRKKTQDQRSVEIIDVKASQVMDIEPLGSHGPAWVFFADGGKALLMVGQWPLQYQSFPAASFRLYRWADTKQPIRIETTGRRLEPQHSAVRLPSGGRLSDIEIFDATPETLQSDLDKASAK
jgi:hypothetical protein